MKISWRHIHKDFFMRLWGHEMCHWTFHGGCRRKDIFKRSCDGMLLEAPPQGLARGPWRGGPLGACQAVCRKPFRLYLPQVQKYFQKTFKNSSKFKDFKDQKTFQGTFKISFKNVLINSWKITPNYFLMTHGTHIMTSMCIRNTMYGVCSFRLRKIAHCTFYAFAMHLQNYAFAMHLQNYTVAMHLQNYAFAMHLQNLQNM